MSLTAISLFESARRQFFIHATQNTCKNLESNVFGLRRRKCLTAIKLFQQAR